MSKQQISNWLKELISDCYLREGLPPPEKVKGHDVRKQALSWADMAGVSSKKICDAATWSSDCTFARHYKLNLRDQVRSTFGRKILHKTASSSAEKALRRHLGPTNPIGANSVSDKPKYRIPRKKKSETHTK